MIFLNQLPLRFKILIILSILCSILFFLIYSYNANQIATDFAVIENTDAMTNLDRVNESFSVLGQNMISKLGDWGQWDDAYDYIQTKNPQFAKSNFQPSISNLKLNFFTFWTNEKNMLWGSNIDLETDDDEKKLSALSEDDQKILRNITFLHTFRDAQDKKTTFVLLSQGPYLVATVPITSSDGKAPVMGKIISGVRLDNSYFERMSTQLKLKISASLVEQKGFLSTEISKFKKNINYVIEPINDEYLKASGLIKDFKNENLLLFQVVITRSIFQQSQISLHTFLYSMIFAAFIFVVFMILSLDGLVVSKLLKLSKGIDKIRKTGDLKLQVPYLGGDELGQLGNQFNQMIQDLDRLRAANLHNETMASLGEMAGGIAHEINNPLTIISGASKMIKKIINGGIQDTPKLLKYIDDIDKTVLRISKIISGMRNISRNAESEEFTPCSLEEVIKDTIAVCHEKFKVNGVELIWDSNNPSFKLPIPCLRVQLSQVILNLVNNSFDAICKTENPWVKISATQSEGFIELTCEDSGLGIPLEIQSKIFEPFFTTKEVGKGTGLGLSLSNSIVNRHGGKMSIDNEKKNTCFVIKLPLKRSESENEPKVLKII
ncbi:MAG: CHASE4 domain-containing protein [Bacteriovoracaceae bacterium]|nr:CHASE4 domain-containing protein [Bacteriovoracaceae bacterium]